mmetsp:Transcript_103018/g.183008  ORF Transcript_103018/g.183008 Transcript_103018/m.183008 type:complete len:685 (-) Transcript_103018:71-2125(-)|eukprot:CAMPEP_0197664722 /NCGR_PEP_ID=MMETSP1338-20131121/58809_1 /TAXON_ID=43686 ORGANISM="Pelagodinium beii, Strain RCC1491" /NCGR_SAMPLE_ID=MMETSP1338 /ASSEMBLY_ACC=CAM_ASM_000754 /LENGTH=684 /DNA_ID=CAMNT_0043243421 /DNA_START=47 /DNA_END=2101 /DNA_ORIENTATION=-
MPEVTFKKGDDVLVFYRMGKRCRPERKYMAVMDPRQGSYRPRTGMSDGWVPARVAADQDHSHHGGNVKIAYTWPHFFTQRGQMTDSSSNFTEWYEPKAVKAATGNAQPGAPLMPDTGSRPALAILTFRWGGMNEIIAPEQWGSTGSSVSDIFINAFVDVVDRHLQKNYEVWTVYIEDKSDMTKIADAAHLIFGPSHPLRRAEKVCAMYHLYPTGFEEHCVPTSETGGDGGAALVDQKAVFRMMQAVERAGIPTRYPHDSGFYELLASKRWTQYMSLVPHLQVPATVALPRMLCEQGSCKEAAQWAHKALSAVRAEQAELRGEAAPGEVVKGVAKLGFSWEALDVKFWEGRDGLETSIYQLTQAIEISDEFTGQPHDMESLIVQEYVQHDLEMRLYVVEGKVEAIIYTKFCRIKENNEFGDFKESFNLADAARQWMGDDKAALEDGERQCRKITAHWMNWVHSQTCQTPPGIRFDYFVGRSGQPGKATVRTLEICELGFSMLGEEELPDKVFRAMLRSCLGGKLPDSQEAPKSSASASKTKSPSKSEAPAPNPASSGTPQVLYITVPRVPNGTPDQQQCTGKYELVAGNMPKGKPLWMHARGDRFLYFGIDNYWYVGDQEEQDANFACDSGYIRQSAQQGELPHALKGLWERGPDWTAENEILVSSDPDAKPPKKSGKTTKSKQK